MPSTPAFKNCVRTLNGCGVRVMIWMAPLIRSTIEGVLPFFRLRDSDGGALIESHHAVVGEAQCCIAMPTHPQAITRAECGIFHCGFPGCGLIPAQLDKAFYRFDLCRFYITGVCGKRIAHHDERCECNSSTGQKTKPENAFFRWTPLRKMCH